MKSSAHFLLAVIAVAFCAFTQPANAQFSSYDDAGNGVVWTDGMIRLFR